MRIVASSMSAARLFSVSSFSPSRLGLGAFSTTPQKIPFLGITTSAKRNHETTKKTKKKKEDLKAMAKSQAAIVKEKRRTRSDREFELDSVQRYGDTATHIPVLLGEVLDVFSASKTMSLRSFVDCTVGAAGHSSAIIQAHPELRYYVGMDIDPLAREKAVARIDSLLRSDSRSPNDMKTYTFLKNFRYIKSVLSEVDVNLLDSGVDGVLMDLGMSSMQVNNPERGFSVLGDGPLDMRMDPQASLRAEDILNSWPDAEVGRILREYGEESNWHSLQNKIVKARSHGGLHSTGELVDLIRNATSGSRGGRQGWIKTATRVFQALRIAVNDEMKTLEDSLYACFDCLAPGGRLAVISFHSLEDRIVKQTFLDIIGSSDRYGDMDKESEKNPTNTRTDIDEKEAWIKQMIHGSKGTILTKRPITPCEEEEKLNRRSRSAKLRVIQKI
ncbi:Ribosomal RNA small subunit methyltransferase H [Trema orientale]|uniref:Ribosomal RNA small subunit methyltransferase H n=1 Tax=Trema orientale TaxID=63057 RepID=A0A2P5G164_TREOI|nr:Ribosomal RNA small subunit methyltransferase H [Trema orientale]